jgi:hypothetical protein
VTLFAVGLVDISAVRVGTIECFLPAEDMNAQDGAATGRLLSAGVLESIAYCGQPGAAVFHVAS